MKKLISMLLAAAMLLSVSGCMVNMNETLDVPVETEDGEEVVFYTYMGEAVAPITLEYGADNIPAGKQINVIKLNPEGVQLWSQSLTAEEKSDIKLLAADLDYEIKIAKEALDTVLSDPESELTDEEREAVEAEAALFDMSLLQSGISIAAFNSLDAQKRVDVKYPGMKILNAYTLSIGDINGVYPVTGTSVELNAVYAIPEGEEATDVLIIAPNRVVANRHAKVVGDTLKFTVPSTIGTLILVVSK